MSYETNEDTNDTNKGDNAKDEDDDDNDEIDKEISYENDHKSGEIDDNLLNLIIQTNAKLKDVIEVNLNNQWDTEMDHYPAQGEQLSIDCMMMGESLFTLLQHIHKLPTPPPIADTINNVNEFCNSSIFLTNDGGKSSQHLLSYILDGNTTLKENNAQTADHSLSYILNNDQEESLVSTSSYWTKELGESSKNSYNTGAMIYYYDSKEHETEIKAACSKLSKNIFNIYETSLEQEVQADYMRKDQFLQTNNLVSADEGRRLYKEYKEKCKKERYEYLRNLYIGTNRRNDLLENEINDEKDEEDEESEEDEEDEKRIDLLF
ncbi:hypothetical protein GLOIN_2v1790542 [Rhizophagus irregularis DAOM 181602=DAOM 197198]|nr:hypothetical protein GLOIN_2v1790542 [Rhizophagus irregularis DAOM 181602=DAOM 197198]